VGQRLVIPGAGASPPATAPVPVPTTTIPPSGPSAPATVARLPPALFGSLANDPQRLALVPAFDRWADAYQVPRDLLKAFGFVESGWRTTAVSSSGAIGVGQLMPDTARWVATTLIGDPTLDPRNPEHNIRMSARYIRYLLDFTGGDEQRAIGSYYQGPGSVSRNGLSAAGLAYVGKVQTARPHFR
jgi:soluble lytic murein transglycosylase-like protein